MSSGEPDIFEVLGNETRRKILEILSEEPAYLNELSRELRVSQQAILKHLEYLLNKGLIEPCDVEDAGGTPPKKYYRLSKSLLFFGELAPNMMEYIVSSPTQALDRTSYRIDIDAQMLRAKLEQIVSAKDSNTLHQLREFIRSLEGTMQNIAQAYSLLAAIKQEALEAGREELREKLNSRQERRALYKFLAMTDDEMKEYFESVSRDHQQWAQRLSSMIESMFG